MLSKCYTFEKSKEIVLGNYKHKWIIKTNEAIQLYLKMYFKIGCIDHLIQNAKISYCTLKYWHSPMTYEKVLAVVVAYDMYLE